MLTTVDRFSRWPVAVRLRDITADTVTTNFYTYSIARFGTPKTITTGQGSQFESALFNALSRLMASKHIHTTPYHPAGSGLAERWHRTLKDAIRCHQSLEWIKKLPKILIGLRTPYKEDLKASTTEFLYSTILRIPGEFFTREDPPEVPQTFLEPFRLHMRDIKAVPAAHHSKRRTFCFRSLYTCTRFSPQSRH